MEETTGEGSRPAGGPPSVDLGLPGYTDYHEIGRGGFSVVYKATQSDFGRTVAIKVISGSADETTMMRFERECRTMGTLSDHPNIVTVFGNGRTEKGDLYIAMEFLGKGSLADRLAQGPMPWDEVVDVGIRIAEALQAAHDAGVLHRDVKPENIFVSNYGEAKLGDFGIARLEGGTATKSGVITASIAHAAPEILDGKRPSEASDVYSLGSTLYTLLAGRPAFVSETDESIVPMLARIAVEPIPDLRGRGVPGPVCEVLEASMAKRLEQRIPSAKELAERLRSARDAVRSGVATVAPPPVPITPVVAPMPAVTVAPAPYAPTGQYTDQYTGQPAGSATGQYTDQYAGQYTGQYTGQQPAPMYPGYGATGPVPEPKQGGGAKVALVVVLVLLLLGGLGAVGVAMAGKDGTATTTSAASGVSTSTAPSSTTSGKVTTTVASGDLMIALVLGDCFDHPDIAGVLADTAQTDVAVKQVDCDNPHDMQIVAQEVIKAGRSDPYPADLADRAAANCRTGFESFVGTSFDNVADRYGAMTVYPDEAQWSQGQRNMVCAAYTKDGRKMTATLQGAG